MTKQELELRMKALRLAAELEYYTILINGYADIKSQNDGEWPDDSYRIIFNAMNTAYIEKLDEQERLMAMLYDLTH